MLQYSASPLSVRKKLSKVVTPHTSIQYPARFPATREWITRFTGSRFAAALLAAAPAADVLVVEPALPTATHEPKGPARAWFLQRTRHASPLGPPVQLTPLEGKAT